MEKLKDIIDESKELLNHLYKEDKVKPILTEETVRNNLMNFISNQMESVSRREVLSGLLEAEIARKILLHELSLDDLKDFFKIMSSEKTSHVATILEPFSPSNATPNAILTPPISKTNEEDDVTKSLSSGERQALQKLQLLLEGFAKKAEENNKEESKKEAD